MIDVLKSLDMNSRTCYDQKLSTTATTHDRNNQDVCSSKNSTVNDENGKKNQGSEQLLIEKDAAVKILKNLIDLIDEPHDDDGNLIPNVTIKNKDFYDDHALRTLIQMDYEI